MGDPLLDGRFDSEIRYLLQRMEPEERDTFGHRVIEDEEVFDRVREAETELYDAYARSALPREWAADFRAHLLQTPAQQRRLAAARALARRRAGLRMTPAALLALAAGVIIGFVALPRLLSPRGGAAEVWALSAGQTRAGVAAVPEFDPPRGETVSIRIPWDDSRGAGPFRVQVGTAWFGEAKPEGGNLSVPVPASAVRAPGLYEVTVSAGTGELAAFAEFKVRGGATPREPARGPTAPAGR